MPPVFNLPYHTCIGKNCHSINVCVFLMGFSMRVKDLMTDNLQVIDAEETVAHAASLMKKNKISGLPVISNSRIQGMVTYRDIVWELVSRSWNPTLVKVKEIMSGSIIYCENNHSIEKACDIMQEHHIQRLLVLDERGLPSGMITFGDVLYHCHERNFPNALIQRLYSHERRQTG